MVVTIEMGQAFRHRLPDDVRAVGGEVLDVDITPTEVIVLAAFPDTQNPKDVQRRLFEQIGGPRIVVERSPV